MSDRSIDRTAGMPRGLLRFLVLRYLVEKPLSGKEIVEEIWRETGGKWKPSSGSIYPLLAWLQAKGFVSETYTAESGMKRYLLTDEGKEFFKEQVRLGQKFMEKMRWLAPLFIRGFNFSTDDENLICAQESSKKVLETIIELDAERESLGKEDYEEIAKILDESNRQLRKIIVRIDSKK